MRVKDMFLKNEYYLCKLFLIIFLLYFCKISLAENVKLEVLNHLNSLNYFSASFLQNDGKNLSEGRVYIGNKRVRAEYTSPTKILIILDEDKAMYYNYELEEDEFFNPRDTNAWFFYDIFRNPAFFEGSLISQKNNELILEKRGVDKNENNFLVIVYFETNPLVLRAVEFLNEDAFLKLSIYNHNYNEDFEKDFFKLINPKFLN